MSKNPQAFFKKVYLMTKLLNKKEPLMKQGGFEIFVLCLNCYIYIVGNMEVDSFFIVSAVKK